jgi:hypothetical protein
LHQSSKFRKKGNLIHLSKTALNNLKIPFPEHFSHVLTVVKHIHYIEYIYI